MRQWPWTRIVILSFVTSIAMVVLWLFMNFRSHTLGRLDAHEGQLDQSQKAAQNLDLALKQNDELRKVIQENLEKAPKLPVAPPPVPVEPDHSHLAKSRIQAAKNHGRTIEGLIASAEKEATAWTAYQKSLFQGETGRRIAASKEQVAVVVALLEKERPAVDLPGTWSVQLRNLLDPVVVADTDPAKLFLPSEGFLQDLTRLEQSARQFIKAYEQDRRSLEAILAESQANTLSEKGLKQVSDEIVAELAKDRAAKVAAAKKAAFDEATQTIARAEADAAKLVGEEKAKEVREKADLEARRIASETAIEKAKTEQLLEIAKRKAEKDRLKRLAEDPSIQAKYQAFLQPGHLQFSSSPGSFYADKSERPQPASFGALSGFGWLKDSKSFALAVSKHPARTTNVHVNDRPCHPYPRNEAEWGVIDRMLEEFRMLGPVWVEMKLLRP